MLPGDQRMRLTILDAFHAYHEVICPTVFVICLWDGQVETVIQLYDYFTLSLICKVSVHFLRCLHASAVLGSERLFLLLERFEVFQVETCGKGQ